MLGDETGPDGSRAGGEPRARWVWLAAVVGLAVVAGLVLGELDGPPTTPPLDAPGRWSVHHPLDKTTAVAPAPDGGVWVGTATGGLVRWDADGEGYTRHLDGGRAHRHVSDVVVGGDGTVWAVVGSAIGHQDRMVRRDGEGWTTVSPADFSGMAGDVGSQLAVDDDGVLWAATDAGLARVDGRRWRLLDSKAAGPPSRPTEVAVDAEGALWTATRQVSSAGADGGADDEAFGRVARLDGDSWTTWTGGGALPEREVSALAAGADGSVWIAMTRRPGPARGGHLVRFAGGEWTVEARDDAIPASQLRWLAVDAHGGVWMPVDNVGEDTSRGGVARLDGDGWTTHTVADGLPHAVVGPITAAGDTVWVATEGGAARFADGQWNGYVTGEGPGGNAVSLAVGDRRVWTAGWSHVSSFDGQRWTRWSAGGPPDNRLASDLAGALTVGPDGTAWVSTRHGVARFDGDTWHTPISGEDVSGEPVRALAVSDDGAVWVALGSRQSATTGSRVIRYVDGAPTTYTRDDGVPYNPKALAIAHDGTVWVGSEGGVARFDAGQWTTFTTDDGLPAYKVQALAVRGHTVWAGTANGLARFDGDQWHTATSDDNPLGLPPGNPVAEGNVQAVAVDDDGIVWAATHDSLSRFDGSQWTTAGDAAPPVDAETLAVNDDAVWIGTRTRLWRFDRD